MILSGRAEITTPWRLSTEDTLDCGRDTGTLVDVFCDVPVNFTGVLNQVVMDLRQALTGRGNGPHPVLFGRFMVTFFTLARCGTFVNIERLRSRLRLADACSVRPDLHLVTGPDVAQRVKLPPAPDAQPAQMGKTAARSLAHAG